jgi:hypothetical protein
MASTPAPVQPEELGMGYDRVRHGLLDYSAVTAPPRRKELREGTYHLKICENAAEVASALNIDASVSASYLNVASTSVKSQFMESLKLTTRSVTIVVYAYRESAEWTLKSPRLDGVSVPTAAQLADFVATYGDSFVDKVVEGAEYFAAYAFHLETSEQQRSFALQVKAELNLSVKAAAEVQTKLSNLASSSSMSQNFDHKISGVAESAPAPAGIVEFAQKFSSFAVVAPKTLRLEVTGYERIPSLRTPLAAMATTRQYFLGTPNAPGLYGVMNRLKGLQNQADLIKSIHDCYNYTGDIALKAFRKDLQDDLKALDDQIIAYAADPARTFVRPQLKSLDKGEPVLEFVEPQPVTFGGSGGGPVDFGPVRDALRRKQRISSIVMWGKSDRVPRIEVTYKDEKGEAGKREVAFGGRYGKTKDRLDIDDGDFPHLVSWISGDYVEFLAILLARNHGTTDQRGTNAGGGTSGQKYWTAPDGYVVLGIGGRGGDYVDQIRIVYAALRPTRFVLND